MSVVQNKMPLTKRAISGRSDQCLALIGLLGAHWLADPAVACGSAVNEVDWASMVVGGAISAWH